MKVDRATWEKWRRWVGLIEADLEKHVDDQAVFDTFSEVVEKNGPWIDTHQGGDFVQFVRRNFAAATFMAIRRQVKVNDTQGVSLLRLLTEVAEQSHQLTYQRYLSFHPLARDGREWQRDVFNKLSDDGQVVSKRMVEGDIRQAVQLSAQIEEIADREVAHIDPKGTAAKVTFADLRACLGHFDELTVKYILFFTGTSYADDTMKAKLAFDPRRIFQHPFIEPKDS